MKELNEEIEFKKESERKLHEQIESLRRNADNLGAELAEYRAMNQSTVTVGTNATQYIPIVPNPSGCAIQSTNPLDGADALNISGLSGGSLPDSDISEVADHAEEMRVLREENEKLKSDLAAAMAATISTSGSINFVTADNGTAENNMGITEGPLDDTEYVLDDTEVAPEAMNVSMHGNFEEMIEKLEREREEQLMAKNEQIEELEGARQEEKAAARDREDKLRAKVKELNAALDKAQGFKTEVVSDEMAAEEAMDIRQQNDFLQKQAEEFADELEKTLNQEEETSKENVILQQQVLELKTELDAIKTETPERFERLISGYGNERKEFDEVHEKIFDENEQLRKALVKMNLRVKEFTCVINKEHNASLDISQIGKGI